MPLAGWLRGAHRDVVEEYVLGERAAARGIFEMETVRSLVARHDAGENLSEHLFRLINFEMWMRRFVDREA